MQEIVNKVESFDIIFEGFRIEYKIKELSSMIKQASLDLSGGNVVIILPMYDESMRLIELEDQALFQIQNSDAHALAEHVILNMGADCVSIINSFNGVRNLSNDAISQLTCFIFLHEFINAEKNMILTELMKTRQDLKYFEAY